MYFEGNLRAASRAIIYSMHNFLPSSTLEVDGKVLVEKGVLKF
jgi:hypothetical protein